MHEVERGTDFTRFARLSVLLMAATRAEALAAGAGAQSRCLTPPLTGSENATMRPRAARGAIFGHRTPNIQNLEIPVPGFAKPLYATPQCPGPKLEGRTHSPSSDVD